MQHLNAAINFLMPLPRYTKKSLRFLLLFNLSAQRVNGFFFFLRKMPRLRLQHQSKFLSWLVYKLFPQKARVFLMLLQRNYINGIWFQHSWSSKAATYHVLFFFGNLWKVKQRQMMSGNLCFLCQNTSKCPNETWH